MSSLPEELHLEILLKVPVKSLVTCKFVCKYWFNLISDSNFVKSHLNLTVQKNNPSLMLRDCNGVIHSINYNSLWSGITEFDDNAVDEMDCPFNSSDSTVKLMGSCNGLVCFWINYKVLCIWNPATNEYKKLQPRVYGKKDRCTYGFGYDNKTDCYKLVNLVSNAGNHTCLIEVYTLGSNMWKGIQTIPYEFYADQFAVLINGVLYWVGTSSGNYNSLISFEISSEIISELQLPNKESLENNFCRLTLAVGEIEGRLCVLNLDSLDDFRSDAWVMQDYGVQESWTKISFDTSFIEQYPLRVMGSSENGKILYLSGNDNLIIYDKKQRQLKVCDSVKFTSGVKYFESLVSLKSSTYSGIEAHGGIN